jgi:hypothetical protein
MTGTPSTTLRACGWLVGIAAAAGVVHADEDRPLAAEVVELRKIWDQAPHNAFTDLVRFDDRWFCTFREGKAHVSPDGALRVIMSRDGREWQSAARIEHASADLRDPKLALAPDGKLMLTAAAALDQPAEHRHQTLIWYSADGREWGEPIAVGDPDFWLWRTTWHGRAAYNVGYHTAGGRSIRLYRSTDGRSFAPLVERLAVDGSPSESTLWFGQDGAALCLVRRDDTPSSALLGSASAPYREWTWKDLGVRVGGPHLIRLPDGRYLAAGRRYDGRVRTAIMQLDPAEGRLTELAVLPSAGDTSYPGLVWHDEVLWVSYYSSHEGKTSIYLAKVRLRDKE